MKGGRETTLRETITHEVLCLLRADMRDLNPDAWSISLRSISHVHLTIHVHMMMTMIVEADADKYTLLRIRRVSDYY